MPIKAENKHRYPANWREIRAAILERARHCCEFCGRPNHVWATKAGAWRWKKKDMEALSYPGEKVYRIVLAIAHLDHNPENCDGMENGGPAVPTWRIQDSNLRALCQRCHLAWDAVRHQQTAYRTRRSGKAMGDLFDAHP